MDLGLEGKNAIITGGSLGIGASIALVLAEEGCNIAINYRRHDTEAKAVVAKAEAMGWRSRLMSRAMLMRRTWCRR
jgi:NAD(P)-dependent dehydrogenase (short-subunit alcohol dehydrogenase family)